MMQPIKPEAVAQMREILNGIKDGTLKHKQDTFTEIMYANESNMDSCGTAHCFAGWKLALDMQKLGQEPHDETIRYSVVGRQKPMMDFAYNAIGRTSYLQTDLTTHPIWAYAMENWGLSRPESHLMFQSEVTLEEIEDVIMNFESGLRFDGNYWGPAEETPDVNAELKKEWEEQSARCSNCELIFTPKYEGHTYCSSNCAFEDVMEKRKQEEDNDNGSNQA